MKDLDKRFQDAVQKSRELETAPDTETLLELYSYFKQATEGDAGSDRPGAFDFKARAKYDAWKARAGMSAEIAKKGYIKLVEHLESNG